MLYLKQSEIVILIYIFTVNPKKQCGIMCDYEETEKFWDNIFKEKREFDVKESLSKEEIEEGVNWLSKDSDSIIDFGCGNGSLLLRSGYLSGAEIVGIDISEEAVNSAKRRAENNGYHDNYQFICGGLETLSHFDEDEFQAGILSNVVDNLIPEDARNLLSEFHRIINEDGKVLLKLNDYIDPKQLEEWGSKEISDDFYQEETGLYFWNLTDDEVEDLISTYFNVEKRVDVEFQEQGQINRMYYLRNKG